MDANKRCSWANGDDALMAQYHDEEWGVPQRDPRMLWEMLMLEGFQAGLSWRTILHTVSYTHLTLPTKRIV